MHSLEAEANTAQSDIDDSQYRFNKHCLESQQMFADIEKYE